MIFLYYIYKFILINNNKKRIIKKKYLKVSSIKKPNLLVLFIILTVFKYASNEKIKIFFYINIHI